MSNSRTRARAAEILLQAEKPGAHSSALLQRAATQPSIHFPLLQRMVKGTLQWRDRIDVSWEKAGGEKLAALPAAARNLVRIAVYQLLFLERVDAKLVFSESSELLGKIDAKLAPRLMAVLTKLGNADKEALPRAMDFRSAEEIAQTFSHPLWLVSRWVEQWGLDETAWLCAANNKPWPVSVRVNPLKSTAQKAAKSLQAQGVHVNRGRYVRGCFHLRKLPRDISLEDLDAFHYGLVQVQDESSALMSLLLDPRPGESILDLCAAPGGKAVHIAALMKNEGRVLAVDIHDSKLALVKENCKRQGVKIVRLKAADAVTLSLASPADRILLDAPCSGLGVLGRKADIRWAKDEKSLEELARLQRRLLENAAALLRPGGRLVYSTCTIEPMENEAVVEAFLAAHPEFKLIPPPPVCPADFITAQGYVRTWPHRHGIGGAFAAVMEKQG